MEKILKWRQHARMVKARYLKKKVKILKPGLSIDVNYS